MMETREVTVCLVYDPEAVREAIEEMRDAGFMGDDISVLAPDREHDKGEKAKEGAITGAVAGGLFGGLAGALIGMGVPGKDATFTAGRVQRDRTHRVCCPRQRGPRTAEAGRKRREHQVAVKRT